MYSNKALMDQLFVAEIPNLVKAGSLKDPFKTEGEPAEEESPSGEAGHPGESGGAHHEGAHSEEGGHALSGEGHGSTGGLGGDEEESD